LSVVVDQFLHGYSNGHRLLASSRRPEPELASLLLSHSDAPAAADTSLLASLPLPRDGAWALSCVWAAEEIERPGSVWTHTLLLDRKALGELRGAEGLLRAFRRPSFEDDLQTYREALRIDQDSLDLASNADLSLAPSIVLATYGWPGRSTAVITEDLESAARVLMAVWQRQWPALRAEFRFRTRQRLGEEESGGIEVARRSSRRPVDDRIDLLVEDGLSGVAPSWLDPLCEELRHSTSPLEEFLRVFGPEAPSGRSDLPALTRIEQALRVSHASPAEAVSLLARSYPRPGQMEGLKLALLGPGKSDDEEASITLALDYAEVLPWSKLHVPRRLGELWVEGRHDLAISLLLKAFRERPELTAELLEPLAAAAEPSMVAALATAEPALAGALLRLEPRPLASEALWAAPRVWQQPLLMAIAEAEIELPARSFLEHADDEAIASALSLGLVSVSKVARTIAVEASDRNLERWSDLLGERQREIATTLANAKPGRWQEVALAVAASAPADRALLSRHASTLAEHFEQMGSTVRLRSAAAIFSSAGAEAIERMAVGKSFATLHRATGKKLLAAGLTDYFPQLKLAEGKIGADLRERLVQLVVEENWEAPEIAYALENAGPGAGKVRELTPKKSDLRKLMNASWKLAKKGVDLAKRIAGEGSK
jgi:GTPase-associated protein 1, N-terminal domain type 1